MWHNLVEQDDLGTRLCAWFERVIDGDDVGAALERGLDIPGLGVSFASKHLRMLQPRRFAVLDSVLSEKLGFALNIAGYKFFLRELHAFRSHYHLREPIGTLETGIYLLIK